ncbi:MAG: hypothetical protein CSB23_04070 [Deltaproteobacteria bacterium]|nr:MAG: hypothetical protein CSB23_04070 [Deltaproteobacteria bacterium]
MRLSWLKQVPFRIIVLFFLSALFVHGIQRTQTGLFPPVDSAEDFKYLPSGAFLKGAALDFDEVLADLLWIKSIGYLGEHFRSDKKFPWLYQLIDVTTSLDPYFDDPYEFGGIIYSSQIINVDKSIAILKKGMENVPKHHHRYWYLPFFTAFNYMYHKQDYQTAARYLEMAASFPQSPKYLPMLVARLYANTDDPGVAIPFLEEMAENAATPEIKEKYLKRIKEIQVKQNLLHLSQAKENYQQTTGKQLQRLSELVESGILASLPEEPLGGRYYISGADGTIQTTSQVDDMSMKGPLKKRQKQGLGPENKKNPPVPFL